MKLQRVSDVMTAPVTVVSPDTGFKDLVDVLSDAGIGAVPVVDEAGAVVGVVSEADLLHKIEFGAGDVTVRLFERRQTRTGRAKANAAIAGELMTSPVVAIAPDATVSEAARLMDSRRVKRLPVLDESGALVGIVSRRDLLRPYLRPDAEIRAEIREDLLRRALWLDPDDLDVSVIDGRVTLTGKVDRRSTAAIIAAMTRGVSGVVGVTTELTWDYDDTTDLRRRYRFDAEVGVDRITPYH